MRFAWAAVLLFLILPSGFLLGQNFAPGHQSSRDPLTDNETEQIRRLANTPPERVKLYMQFLDEHSAKISSLNKTALVEHRGLELHDAIARFSGLADELQDNLDEYQGYETNNMRPVPDLRKTLPALQSSLAVWQTTLSSLPANGDYDFALETADESLKSLQDQIAEMTASQEKYFAQKKKRDKDQQKQEDKPYALP